MNKFTIFGVRTSTFGTNPYVSNILDAIKKSKSTKCCTYIIVYLHDTPISSFSFVESNNDNATRYLYNWIEYHFYEIIMLS